MSALTIGATCIVEACACPPSPALCDPWTGRRRHEGCRGVLLAIIRHRDAGDGWVWGPVLVRLDGGERCWASRGRVQAAAAGAALGAAVQ